ncbi:hypothetical protein X975_20604, partial [Stegodyphus mimosarum]
MFLQRIETNIIKRLVCEKSPVKELRFLDQRYNPITKMIEIDSSAQNEGWISPKKPDKSQITQETALALEISIYFAKLESENTEDKPKPMSTGQNDLIFYQNVPDVMEFCLEKGKKIVSKIWTTENPFGLQPLPLHSEKVTVWCRITPAFVVGPFFFEEITSAGPITCTVTGKRYEALLRNHVLPTLQQRQCVDRTIFMQDGAPPHIATLVKQLLISHFGDDRIISRHFPTAWPPRSPDLNPCDFWLWGYLKNVVYSGRIANLADLKTSIMHHIHSISTDTLRSVVEPAVLLFQLAAEQGGEHIEQLMH